jgi:mannan endo-1,4-beta-mannosidase
MKRALLMLVFSFLPAAYGPLNAQPSPSAANVPTAEPVNPNATPEARALLKELDSLSGHATLTGQHNFPNHVSRWSDRVYDLTGKYPALFGQDFGFAGGDDKDSVEGRPAMIDEVKRQYRNGAVIALCWHAVRPTDDEPVTFRDSVQGHLTDFEWNELLTPGTKLNARWMAQVDVIAGYLKQLQQAHVPVLFRPYHEMNGNWFWWGGRPGSHGSAELYRMLYERFVNYHHLNNLIWVWNVNSPSANAGDVALYDPGHPYADLYTVDIYGEFKQSYYDQMLALAGNKPIALAEVGTMPTLEVFAQQPRWTYFMMWSGMAEGSNSPELLEANFHAPNLRTRDDAGLAKPSSDGVIDAAEPVSRNSIPEVRALLARLHETAGATTLSGQQNTVQDGSLSAATSTDQVFAATGHYPAIYGADFSGSDQVRDAVVAEAKRQSKANTIISLSWTAPMPTAQQEEGKERALTNFEWSELLTPETTLNRQWAAQVDLVAHSLKQLQDAKVPVLWNPYPEANGKLHWWAGRPGIHGSAELYRMLFDRLVNRDHIENLVWVWNTAPAGFGPAANGAYVDYYPGLLYTDALALSVEHPNGRIRTDSFLNQFNGSKLSAVLFPGLLPEASYFSGSQRWSWFLLGPPAGAADTVRALQTLYADPRIAARDSSGKSSQRKSSGVVTR